MHSNATPRADSDGRTLRVRTRDAVPSGAPVRHFDELPDSAKQLIADYGDQASVAVTPETAALFADEPVIVFSEYLQLELV